jgi:hypothetical protein
MAMNNMLGVSSNVSFLETNKMTAALDTARVSEHSC